MIKYYFIVLDFVYKSLPVTVGYEEKNILYVYKNSMLLALVYRLD